MRGVRGTGRRVRGGAGARLPAPRALELVMPDAADRMTRGSGWGNTPRPLVQLSAAMRLRAGEPHASCEASWEGSEGALGNLGVGGRGTYRIVCVC